MRTTGSAQSRYYCVCFGLVWSRPWTIMIHCCQMKILWLQLLNYIQTSRWSHHQPPVKAMQSVSVKFEQFCVFNGEAILSVSSPFLDRFLVSVQKVFVCCHLAHAYEYIQCYTLCLSVVDLALSGVSLQLLSFPLGLSKQTLLSSHRGGAHRFTLSSVRLRVSTGVTRMAAFIWKHS